MKRWTMANSADPDQTPQRRGVWSESTLFAIKYRNFYKTWLGKTENNQTNLFLEEDLFKELSYKIPLSTNWLKVYFTNTRVTSRKVRAEFLYRMYPKLWDTLVVVWPRQAKNAFQHVQNA